MKPSDTDLWFIFNANSPSLEVDLTTDYHTQLGKVVIEKGGKEVSKDLREKHISPESHWSSVLMRCSQATPSHKRFPIPISFSEYSTAVLREPLDLSFCFSSCPQTEENRFVAKTKCLLIERHRYWQCKDTKRIEWPNESPLHLLNLHLWMNMYSKYSGSFF